MCALAYQDYAFWYVLIHLSGKSTYFSTVPYRNRKPVLYLFTSKLTCYQLNFLPYCIYFVRYHIITKECLRTLRRCAWTPYFRSMQCPNRWDRNFVQMPFLSLLVNHSFLLGSQILKLTKVEWIDSINKINVFQVQGRGNSFRIGWICKLSLQIFLSQSKCELLSKMEMIIVWFF